MSKTRFTVAASDWHLRLVELSSSLPDRFLFACGSAVQVGKVLRSGAMGKKTPRSEAASPDVSKKAKVASSFPNVASMGASSIGGTLTEVKTYKDQDIHCTCLIYRNKGSVYSSTFDDGQLVVVLMDCAARPNPLFNMKLLVHLYGEAHRNEDEPPPKSLEEVASQYGAEYSFVWKKTLDVDGVGFKRNSSGWFVSASQLKDFFMYLDDLLDYRFRVETGEFESVETRNILVHIPVASPVELK